MTDAYNDIFNAVKDDNIKLFSDYVNTKKEYLTYQYGRFPLLSLCYLYKSKKIVKAYQRELGLVTNYMIVNEPLEAYEKFKKVAKRCLRLYVLESQTVTPMEMLAIIGDSYYLKHVYPTLNKNQRTKENVNKIYNILHNETISQSVDSIAFENYRLSKSYVIIIAIVLILSIILSAGILTSYFVVKASFGIGTEDSPIVIYNIEQFKAMFEHEDKYFKLGGDITIPSDWESKEFNAELDGNGKSINVFNAFYDGVISNLKGKIKNINFNLNIDTEITNNIGFIVRINRGTMENVNVNIDARLSENYDIEELCVSFLTLQNNSDIINCDINADVDYVGDGNNDSFLSLYTARNEGNITDCTVKEGSKIKTDTIDVVAFAIDNIGLIYKSTNNGDIYQTTSSANWSPNAAGFVIANLGEIRDCVNKGKIEAYTIAETENILQVLAAGIAIKNGVLIEKCKNDADIIAGAKNGVVYMAGIVNYNQGYEAMVNNCGTFGTITANPEKSYYYYNMSFNGFVGAICSQNSAASIVDCFSAMSFTLNSQSTIAGAIMGFSDTAPENNFYIKRSNISAAIAWAITTGGSIIEYNNGAIALNDIETLKNQEIYWE